MLKKLLLIFTVCSGLSVLSQECPNLLSPVNGAVNVPVDTSITWDAVDGIPGYQIRLGLTPGGSEITSASIGSATTYTPPLGLPENTTIYVTIVLDFLFEGGDDIVCESQSFTTQDVTTIPGCTELRTPLNEAEGVSVFTNISWVYAATATGYKITLGTASGSGDIANAIDLGNTLTYNPPVEFPPDTYIYVQITPYNENGDALGCLEFRFKTGAVAPLPGCTSLISPLNGALNVPLTPFIEWVPVAGATGYRITIGTTPDNADVLNAAAFFTTSTFVIDFEPNKTYFVSIVPFNDSGSALSCGQELFSTLLGCGPYLDPTTGETITLNPELDFPSNYSFCENSQPLTLNAPTGADGYRWYRLDQSGNEILLSDNIDITIEENGSYLLEAYNLVAQPGTTIECPTLLPFEVVSSEVATITNLVIDDTALGLDITVQATGIGNYEYAIDDSNGPYQDSNIFTAITPGSHTLYVRDKNGCGIVAEPFEQDLTVEGFPKFFTPNGDNINDYWQFIQPVAGENIVLQSIRIYDRFGMFLKEISQNSQGWDGNFNGQPLPSGDYWFRAIDNMNKAVQGHFSLKR